MAQTQLPLGFEEAPALMPPERASMPQGYTGLYRFHKYWGKKPHEPLAFIIERLTERGDVVVDPFMGSGVAGRESVLRGRRFIGYDINPFAVELGKLMVHPPAVEQLRDAAKRVERAARARIEESYLLEDGRRPATHYLWEGAVLKEVWVRTRRKTYCQQEYPPTRHDLRLIESFHAYKTRLVRDPVFFTNSRINASPAMNLSDILTGRAQRNIDLLIDAIDKCSEEIKPALRLCLTAASGQMTKMVFAVTGRGKTSGKLADKTEVGSWVIGFWRPHQHFEVNVWNCFETRVSKLIKSLAEHDPLSDARLGRSAADVLLGHADAFIACGDCRQELRKMPDASAHLVITDPPHSDRMPYLELSEFWNSILGFNADFDREIVHSNAKERGKNAQSFRHGLSESLVEARRVLRADGMLVLLFNAREREEWDALREVCTSCAGGAPALRYLGFFMCGYSARSVVQDNREGSLKSDYALAFARSDTSFQRAQAVLSILPHWSSELPTHMKAE
jgi:hypothetical protein